MDDSKRAEVLPVSPDAEPKRIVIKIGSSTLIADDRSIDTHYLDALAAQISELVARGWQVVIVSSGAIACGLEALGIEARPKDMPSLQAAASVGQSALASAYAKAFSPFSIITSLVLLTRRDTSDRNAYLHARDTFERLLELGVVPVVNENDTVSVEQIKFGDNDTLSALVACLIDADLVVILSDIDGLYDANPLTHPTAQLVKCVDVIDRTTMDAAGGVGSVCGSGGMKTKVKAARVLMAAGIPLAVVAGRAPHVLLDTVDGVCPGTMFTAHEAHHEITPRKLWVALGDSSKGSVIVDDGARSALLLQGASLLSVGLRGVNGTFDPGDCIDVLDSTGMIIARGITSCSSDEVALACGRSREELEGNRLLAKLALKPVIHRDDMMIFD